MKGLLSFKKPLVWILIAVLVLSAVAVWFLTRPQMGEMSPELDACIRDTIRAKYVSDETAGKYPVVAYTDLAVEKKGKDTVVVYGVMMYREYTCTTQDELKTWGTAHSPFVITAKQVDGGYESVECWWPDKGSGYEASIKKRIPLRYREKMVNFQRYYGTHENACGEDALAHIADEDKYTVLQSKGENVWLAYQAEGTYGYIASSGGYSAIGAYAFDGNSQQIFTFGTCKMVLDVNGNHRLYNAEDSERVPTAWEASGGTVYLKHGMRFSPLVRSNTALVGDTLTIKSYNWMTEDEIKKMFGYVPNNSNATDSTAKPYYLPVKVLTSRTQLDLLLASHRENTPWTDLKQQHFTQFDEAFFEKNSLVMVYYNAGSDLPDPAVTSYVYTEEGACLSVRLSVDGSATGDTVLTQWLLFAGIAKSDAEDITVLEAYVDDTASNDEQGGVLSFTGIVKQVEGDSVLMETDDVAQFSSGVWVHIGDAELDPMVGEEYVVTYEDIVMPSLPPRITAVTIQPKN